MEKIVRKFWCGDCGATIRTITLDLSVEFDRQRYDALCGAEDRWGEDEVYGSKLCGPCKAYDDDRHWDAAIGYRWDDEDGGPVNQEDADLEREKLGR